MTTACESCKSGCSYKDKVGEAKSILPERWSSLLTEYYADDGVWVMAMNAYRESQSVDVPEFILSALDNPHQYFASS